MTVDQIMNYVKPELIVVAIVLYFIGIWLKSVTEIKDKYIPFILGGIGILLCVLMCLQQAPAAPARTLQWRFLLQLRREF